MEAISDYPFLLLLQGRDVFKLDVDLRRLREARDAVGGDHVCGCLGDWGVFWDTRATLTTFSEQDMQVSLEECLELADMPAEGYLHETIDITALQRQIDGHVGEKRMAAVSLLDRHAAEGHRYLNLSTIKVTYYRKHGLPGRRYARGASLQKLSRSLRNAALHSCTAAESQSQLFENYDVDMVNAFMQLLWNKLKEVVGDSVDIEYQNFTAYVSNPGGVRKFLATYFGIPEKAAKKALIAILHHGRPKAELPYLWALAVELRMAAERLLELPEHCHLLEMFDARRCPGATRLHYALASLEDHLLQRLEAGIAQEFEAEATANVLMFDGLCVRIEGAGHGARLRRVLDAVGQAAGVRFTMELL